MNQPWSICHTKFNNNIDPVLHLFDRNRKIFNPGLGAEQVIPSIPDSTLFELGLINLDMCCEGIRQFNDSIVPKANILFSLKQSGLQERVRDVFETSLNEGSINDYLEMDYNQWVQGCLETIQGGPRVGCLTFIGALADSRKCELVLIKP